MSKAESEILNDPSTSFWLKEQIVNSSNRDILDVLSDVEALKSVVEERARAMGLL